MESVSASERGYPVKNVVTALAVWWLWMPLGAVVIWFVKHVIFGTYGQQDRSYVLFLKAVFFPYGTPLHPAPLFWIWTAVGLIGTAVILGIGMSSAITIGWFARGAALATAVALFASLWYAWSGLWDADKQAARFYASNTVFSVTGIDPPPSSLRALTTGAHPAPASSGCDYVGSADVPSCIRVGATPQFDWDPRGASFEAAMTVMSQSSSLASQVNVMSGTLHYMPGSASGGGIWTAILDGSGTRPLEGVSTWDGTSNTAGICQFQGDDSFNRAFGGFGGNSLRNLLAVDYPALVYSDRDISGYCDGVGSTARPVIVIPVKRQIGWKNRTVLRPAGDLVLTGSPSGLPRIVYHRTVSAGEFPGQVYPRTIVGAQLAALDWAAGRGNRDDAGFGYQLTSIDTNTANPSQYVLRSNTDGHFYFVTPLTPRNSASQAVVAVAVERADEVSEGLNRLTVYVAADNTNPTSLAVLESRMTTYINQVAPTVLTNGGGGQLREIIPFGTNQWRGFVDIGGVTQDYIDLSSDTKVLPKLVSLSGQSTGTGGTATGPQPACGGDPAALTNSQLAQCIQEFAGILGQRDATG